jgi:hypothetical protein
VYSFFHFFHLFLHSKTAASLTLARHSSVCPKNGFRALLDTLNLLYCRNLQDKNNNNTKRRLLARLKAAFFHEYLYG